MSPAVQTLLPGVLLSVCPGQPCEPYCASSRWAGKPSGTSSTEKRHYMAWPTTTGGPATCSLPTVLLEVTRKGPHDVSPQRPWWLPTSGLALWPQPPTICEHCFTLPRVRVKPGAGTSTGALSASPCERNVGKGSRNNWVPLPGPSF